MRIVRQILAVVGINLRSLPERKGAALTTILGLAGVVAVLVGVLSIAAGVRAALSSNAGEESVVVTRGGTDNEMLSGLSMASTDIIKLAPGLERGDGGPLASSELFVVVDVPRISTEAPSNVPFRGIQPTSLAVRGGSVKITRGRMLTFGTSEVIVGAAASREFAGLALGDSNDWGQQTWTVVGIFEADGTAAESEIWADEAVVRPAYQRGGFFQSVRARLASKDSLTAFKDALTSDPRLEVQVKTEKEFLEGQSQLLVGIITGLGTLVAMLMGFGAVFGALNTMYSAVAARGREIATLRALGFSSLPVVISVLAEALVLALLGGLVGAVGAYFAFNGIQTSTINFQTFSQVAFAFQVTPTLLVVGILYALILGFVGGVFPAIRAARQPVATALREL